MGYGSEGTTDQTVTTGIGGFNNQDLRSLLAGVVNASAQGQAGFQPYMQVGSSEDIINVNAGATTGVLQQIMQLFNQNTQSRNRMGGNAIYGETQRAYEGLLQGKLPGFLTGVADLAAQSAGNIYSGSNALYSGAAQQNITRAATQAVNEQLVPYMSQLGGTFGNLYGTQSGLQQGLLGTAAGLAMPEYFNPTYTQNPFFISPTQAWSLDQTGTAQMLSTIFGGLSSGMSGLGALIGGFGTAAAAAGSAST